MQIEVSVGEIVDKLSILELKKQNIKERDKLLNITKEFEYLYEVVFSKLNIDQEDYQELLHTNSVLWEIEDSLRLKEQSKSFDSEFVSLARNVYITNDKRSLIKKNINIKYNSKFVEEKSYQQYKF